MRDGEGNAMKMEKEKEMRWKNWVSTKGKWEIGLEMDIKGEIFN